MSVFYVAATMVKVFFGFDIKPTPKFLYHIILSEFIMMPC